MFDPNFAFWHSATLSHDGRKVLFTDERGGGIGRRVQPDRRPDQGRRRDLQHHRPAPSRSSCRTSRSRATQADTENCVAHNGNLLPIRSRDILVQAWYQGGISVIDWTNGKKVKEIAWFDRGPFDETMLACSAANWSSYWYNGRIFSNEIQRGFDVHKLTGLPGLLSLATRRLPYANAQTQEPVPRWWD